MLLQQQKEAEKAKLAAAQAAKDDDSNAEPIYELEQIPSKITLVQTLNPMQDVNMLVQHTGKLFVKLILCRGDWVHQKMDFG